MPATGSGTRCTRRGSSMADKGTDRMPEARGFTKWLLQYRGEATVFGEFARAVARDPEWEEPRSLPALESQLQGAGCSHAPLETARRAWRRYVADCAPPRRR
jgi:hypothetical protein